MHKYNCADNIADIVNVYFESKILIVAYHNMTYSFIRKVIHWAKIYKSQYIL